MPALSPSLAVVTSAMELKAFLSSLSRLCTMYVSVEGKSVSRYGVVYIITVLVQPRCETWLIDLISLGDSAFTVASDKGWTLRSVLEDPTFSKCFWDVRNAADALWALHQIGLAGVMDLQLLENGCRTGDKTNVRTLDDCLQTDLTLKQEELHGWLAVRRDVNRQKPFHIFGVRPVPDNVVQYCENDVGYLPKLHAVYFGRVRGDWLGRIRSESGIRVEDCCSPDYRPKFLDEREGPWCSIEREEHKVTLDEAFAIVHDEWRDDRERDWGDPMRL